MVFLYAMLFGGVICAVTQLLAEFKLPFPAIAVIMMVVGGGLLTKAGLVVWMNAVGAGGPSVTAVGCGNGAYTAGAAAAAGVGAPLIICALINIILIALGAFCGIRMAAKMPDKK
ncbi:MAG: hypothetical protein IJH75_03355 [Mogibacterium sp.]|nr:hypothetical protein [Mogibacterium sp.]